MTYYALLSELKAAMPTSRGSDTFHARLVNSLAMASVMLEDETNRRFDRFRDTYWHDGRSTASDGDVENNRLMLADDLQEVYTLTNGDAVEFDSADYELRPQRYPKAYQFCDLIASNNYWVQNSDNARRSISIDGLWGWGGRFKVSGLTLTGDINDSVVSIAITGNLTTAGLEIYQLVQINDELLFVDAAVDTSPVTFERGVNGSTAASHSASDVLYIFKPDSTVVWLTIQLTMWLREIQKSPAHGLVQVGDADRASNITRMPVNITDGIELLKRYKRIKAG